MLFDTVENTASRPVTKAAINAVPVAEFLWQITPCTTVFINVVEGLKKSEVVNLDIATLFGKQMPDTESGKELLPSQRYTSGVESVAFSPDGTKVVTASRGRDNTARIWDWVTAKKQLAEERELAEAKEAERWTEEAFLSRNREAATFLEKYHQG